MLVTRYAASRSVVLACLVLVVASAPQLHAGPAPNSDATYQQLRNITLSGESIAVNNLVLHREVGTFRLRSGTLCFLTPVMGKVTGAVFVGEGSLIIDTALPSERSSLKLLTKGDEFVENFSHMVLRFTDSTYEEVKKTGGAASSGCNADLLQDSLETMRKTPLQPERTNSAGRAQPRSRWIVCRVRSWQAL